MEWYANVVSYPLNIGGRPLECLAVVHPDHVRTDGALRGALRRFSARSRMNRLPQPYHPVFNAPHFERASIDRFFLCIEAADPKFDPVATRAFSGGLEPLPSRRCKQ